MFQISYIKIGKIPDFSVTINSPRYGMTFKKVNLNIYDWIGSDENENVIGSCHISTCWLKFEYANKELPEIFEVELEYDKYSQESHYDDFNYDYETMKKYVLSLEYINNNV